MAAKILVVDDEASIRFFLEETLSNDGHQVVSVAIGQAALAAAEQHEFDLVLLDLSMPGGINGIDVLKVLAKRCPDIPVIILTAHASLDTSIEALRQGAHDYLFKPCKTVELRESIRTGLHKRQRAVQQRQFLNNLQQNLMHNLSEIRTLTNSEVDFAKSLDLDADKNEARFLTLGSIIVDFACHILTIEGSLIDLSPTEFNLIAFMISRSPKVLAPQELVREVQGYESEPWEAREIIRYHMYHIRQKIKEATGRTDIIRTIRGVGYSVLG